MKELTLDEFLKETEQSRSGSEEFGRIAESMEKKHPDVMLLLRDIVYELLLKKDTISAVDIDEKLDEMGVDWFDRRYVGAIIGTMKRKGEIISVGMTRNPRRHGAKIELYQRADFVSGTVLAHIEGVKV